MQPNRTAMPIDPDLIRRALGEEITAPTPSLVQRLFAARPIGCCELRCLVAACVLGAVPWITWLWMELTR